jgi:hypothetical protein
MDILRKRGLSLRVLDGDVLLFESSGSGMKPLLETMRSLGRTRLRGTTVVDKIVGKAAALLIAYFKPREIYCGTLSRRAEGILARYGITYHAEQVVPEICRPGSNDLCPFEEAVLDVETPLQGYRRLVLRLFNLRKPDR